MVEVSRTVDITQDGESFEAGCLDDLGVSLGVSVAVQDSGDVVPGPIIPEGVSADKRHVLASAIDAFVCVLLKLMVNVVTKPLNLGVPNRRR
jgi:hypothetical protein